ncbi:MAG: flagellar basal body-associated FliL family protein [Deltaproteobacteria bacterium]|nr:flagellar basal body-associated FliL family protein [Deltaproteobacteria bacterium]
MSSKKLIIFIIIPLILVNVGAVSFVIWNKTSFFSSQTEKESESEKVSENNSEVIKPIYSLDTFIVNLADKGGRRFLRVTMDLELKNEGLAEEIDKRLSKIRDSILMIIPTKRFEDINSLEGKIVLRDEVMTKLNSFLKNGSITNIYFVEFVIQ